MPSVAVVCTGNLYRSPLAAAFLERLLRERGFADWRIGSAGTWTASGQRLPDDVIRYGQLLGVDLREHLTRRVSRDLLCEFDLILVMERGQKEALMTEFPDLGGRVYMLTELLEGAAFDIPDPVLFPSRREQLLREMLSLIEQAFPRIVVLAQSHGGDQP
jgi:protein-tyrosine-phosphatase